MDILRTKGSQIVTPDGQPIQLGGTCVGGWMNMENFIDGYPGAEHTLRAVMRQVLGASKAQFFFDQLLDYFFSEPDIAFIKSCGATVVRLPLNYRHFESDAQPFRYLEAGFARLTQVVEWCAKHELYVILDLHSVQGWQNPGWHCDNANHLTLFWEHPHFQDRFVALWEEFARRFKGNPTIAGYNVMNEPVTHAPRGRFIEAYASDWGVINHVYRRVVSAICAVDRITSSSLKVTCFPPVSAALNRLLLIIWFTAAIITRRQVLAPALTREPSVVNIGILNTRLRFSGSLIVTGVDPRGGGRMTSRKG